MLCFSVIILIFCLYSYFLVILLFNYFYHIQPHLHHHHLHISGKMVRTCGQLIDCQNLPKNIKPITTNVENNDQNPPLSSHNQKIYRDTGVGHTPSTGTHTHLSPFDEKYSAEISPANALKELMRVILENQILMELYKEQVAANGLKAPLTIIPEKSHASHTKENVSESIAQLINGRERLMSLEMLPRKTTVIGLVRTMIEIMKLIGMYVMSRTYWLTQSLGSFGGRIIHQERIRPQNWPEQVLRKMIYSAITDKKNDGKKTTELARKSLG